MGKFKIFTKDLAQDLGAIIENIYDGLYITDKNANTLMINRADLPPFIVPLPVLVS